MRKRTALGMTIFLLTKENKGEPITLAYTKANLFPKKEIFMVLPCRVTLLGICLLLASMAYLLACRLYQYIVLRRFSLQKEFDNFFHLYNR